MYTLDRFDVYISHVHIGWKYVFGECIDCNVLQKIIKFSLNSVQNLFHDGINLYKKRESDSKHCIITKQIFCELLALLRSLIEQYLKLKGIKNELAIGVLSSFERVCIICKK